MWNKSYILTFDKNSFIGSKEFHGKLTTANGIESWWHYMESSYILIVKENISASDIANYVRQIAPDCNFFTCELNMKNHNGWLQQKAWDWINDQNKNIK